MAEQVLDPQQGLLKALMAAYPDAIQQSANAEAASRMQQNRMDRTRWGGRGLLGAVAGMIGNKVADKRRPAYEKSLSDAMMAKSRSADLQDQISRFRDVAQNKIETNYEYEMKSEQERNQYYRNREDIMADRKDERAYKAELLSAKNQYADANRATDQQNKIDIKQTPVAPAPLTDKDKASYKGKLMDVSDALTVLDNAEAALNKRQPAEGDSFVTKAQKFVLPDTGPIDQYMPGKWGQGFDTMADQLFAVAKRVYKAPGEGMFSDADAAALRGMLFSSGNYADVNLKLITDLRGMLKDRQRQFMEMAGEEPAQLSIDEIAAKYR